MGFFSKVFKSVGKVFKKIGKGIKSAFAKVGKFMGKLGILGQIGLGLLLPGIGGMLGKWAVTAMGSSSAIVSAAGHFVNAAVNIGTKVGSVFKTVTEGVTAVVGETVGAALNVIPGADKLVLSATKGLGINAGQGINIANKSFSSIFDVAGKAMTNVASAGRNLFSMDTLTGTNKFALKDQLQKQLKKDIGDPFRSTEQTLAEKIQATDFDAPKLADGSIDQFAIDPNMPIDSSILEATGKGVVEKAVVEPDSWITKQVKTAVDKTVGTVTDLPSNLIKQAAGLGPQAAQITSYSSAPAQFTAVGTGADSMLMNTGAMQQDMQAGLQGMFGHPALVYNAEQETANFRRTEAQQMAYRGGI
jgi:hypothetical protein